MKSDIIIAGVGGQGIVSIAAVIAMAALENDLCIKQSEVHGMSQRGGAVQSHLRISDKELASDLIRAGSADLIISVEPMEALRYLPWLKPEGWLVSNTTPFVNIPDYPELKEVIAEIEKIPNNIAVDADDIAKKVKSPRSSNMVMLGAASPFIDLPFESLQSGVRKIFGKKGEKIVALNLEALQQGRDFSFSQSANEIK